ncbi:embryogenesis-like protein [Diospyros lotus]|uniref:embryogenesis-like protein n=1 Tax=Diospyros lotus TaxID=55363 RepID=UPI00225613E7|nr:embryogenesis-like protein [Diospyros lotus]
MLRLSANSLCKWLPARHFRRSPIPRSSFSSKPITTPNQFLSDSFSHPNAKKALHFVPPTSSNPSTQCRIGQTPRQYSVDTSKEVDTINLKFAEAREEIEAAMDSKETVYFDEEAVCARDAVKEVLEMYEGLLSKLPENEKAAIQRSMGLKIEQLKAELEQLND